MQIGRTHGQHAEPITLGFAIAEYVARLGERVEAVKQTANNMRGKVSGAVGAYNASALFFEDPQEFEREVLGQRAQKRSLLDALGVPRITLDNALHELAYRAHEGGSRPTTEGGEAGAALVTEDLITGVLQAAFNDLDKVGAFLRYCESANGLVMLQGVAPLPDAPLDGAIWPGPLDIDEG